MTSRQKIVCGDCQEHRFIADIMIADPPYAERVHSKAMSCSPVRGARARDMQFLSLSKQLREWIARAAAEVKRWSIIYTDIESVGDWKRALETAGATYVRAIPWVRWSMPQLSGDRPPQGCEMVIVAYGSQMGRKRWNGPGNLIALRNEDDDPEEGAPPTAGAPRPDALEHKCLRGENKHRAEKPLDQMLDLISWFSDPGETIFDPCAGYGTAGLACRILGRNYTGIELDPTFAAVAQTRIDTWPEQMWHRDATRFNRWSGARNHDAG